MLVIFSLVVTLCVLSQVASKRLSEDERVALWKKTNTWPPRWQPESPELQAKLLHREQEIQALRGADERWENWLQFVQHRLVPKMTETGFKLVQTPPDIQARLKAATDNALRDLDSIRSEGKINAIYSEEGLDPKFVDARALTDSIHHELLSAHEEWIGGEIALKPTSAYGIRIYQNGSSLIMHYDKIETHVISSIVHIGHEYDDDNEPWPIEIEDHEGNLHAVNLEAGQMLFYESAKCLHGRRSSFKGKYYAGVFLHYQPVDKAVWPYTREDVIAAVPPHWRKGTTKPHGDTYAGAGITIADMVAAGAIPMEAPILTKSQKAALLKEEL